MAEQTGEGWACVDCTIIIANGTNGTGLEEPRLAEVLAGIDKLSERGSPYITSDSETGEGFLTFAKFGCDCCGSKLHGEKHKFVLLK